MLKRKKDGKKKVKKIELFRRQLLHTFRQNCDRQQSNHRRVDRRHTANLGRCRMAQYSTVAIDLTY